MKSERYSSYDSGDGLKFRNGEIELVELARLANKFGEPQQISGKQELYESLINRFIK
jgi:xylose isomerase